MMGTVDYNYQYFTNEKSLEDRSALRIFGGSLHTDLLHLLYFFLATLWCYVWGAPRRRSQHIPPPAQRFKCRATCRSKLNSKWNISSHWRWVSVAGEYIQLTPWDYQRKFERIIKNSKSPKNPFWEIFTRVHGFLLKKHNPFGRSTSSNRFSIYKWDELWEKPVHSSFTRVCFGFKPVNIFRGFEDLGRNPQYSKRICKISPVNYVRGSTLNHNPFLSINISNMPKMYRNLLAFYGEYF